MLIGVDWNRSCIMNTFQITLDDIASICKALVITRHRYKLRRRRVVEGSWVGDRCFISYSLVIYVELR
jgi:hypothetical protein